MTMGLFLSCFFVLVEMKVQLSCHSTSRELILNKFPSKRFVLFFVKFSMKGELKFSPDLSINSLFSGFDDIRKGLDTFLAILDHQFLNLNGPFRSILRENQ